MMKNVFFSLCLLLVVSCHHGPDEGKIYSSRFCIGEKCYTCSFSIDPAYIVEERQGEYIKGWSFSTLTDTIAVALYFQDHFDAEPDFPETPTPLMIEKYLLDYSCEVKKYKDVTFNQLKGRLIECENDSLGLYLLSYTLVEHSKFSNVDVGLVVDSKGNRSSLTQREETLKRMLQTFDIKRVPASKD